MCAFPEGYPYFKGKVLLEYMSKASVEVKVMSFPDDICDSDE